MNMINFKWNMTDWVGFTFVLDKQSWTVLSKKEATPATFETLQFLCSNGTEERLFTEHALMGHYILQLEKEVVDLADVASDYYDLLDTIPVWEDSL